MSSTVRSVCPYCGVGCGIVMTVQEGKVVKVAGDREHPTNAGRLCTKGGSCHIPLSAPGRLDRAWLRHDRSHDPVRLEMDLAIDQTASRLKALIAEHGPDALAFYVSGQMSLEAQYLANKLAKGFIRTAHIESNSRLCMASAGSGYKLSLGADGPPGSYQDFDQADVFLVIGANMADCHPILFLRMMDRVKAGAKLIVVDPRRTATAEKADLFLQVRPGTDLALLNGLLHLLHAEDRLDETFIAQNTDGWDTMPELLADYAPDKVASITGLAQQDLRTAAEWLGSTRRFMSCWTMGLNQSIHGTWHSNALCNLHLATGAICQPGAGPFSLTGQPNAMGGREMGYMGPGLPGQRSALVEQDRAAVEAIWALPPGSLRAEAGQGTVAMFEAMGRGDIKACWIICTNPVASVANRQTVIDGLKAAELVICQDAFLDTETNRYADVLLPGALWAEAEGVMINSERNLTLTAAAVPAPGQALPDWQIIARIACAMGYAEAFNYDSAAQVFDELKRFHNPSTGYDLRGVSHGRLAEGPVQWPCAPDATARNPIRYRSETGLRFPTANGRAKFFARPWLPPAEAPDDAFPLVLNTGRLQHHWHTLTKTGKVPALNKLAPTPFVEINPADAQALGIGEDDQVQVRSRRGLARLPARLSDRVLPGNCFAPMHWNDLYGDDLAINAVTSDAIDPISQQPAFKYCCVDIARVGPPKVPLFDAAPSEPAPVVQETASMPVQALSRLLGLEGRPLPSLAPDEQQYMQGFLMGLAATNLAGEVPVLPASAPLAAERRLLIDGVLAGLFSRAQPGALALPAAPAQAPVRVLWASQTGNAETLAGQCAEQLRAAGLAVEVNAMESATAEQLGQARALVLIASTFGDGDAPDNGAPFWTLLQNEEASQRCAGRPFAVLALGDSNYGQFCGFGRKLDERLRSLGATPLLERVECEPDYQAPAEAWLASLQSKLLVVEETAPAPVQWSRAQPYPATLTLNRVLNGTGSSKEVRQLEFDLGDSGLVYEAGDALGIWPVNDPALVNELLDVLGLDGEQAVTLKDLDLTLRQALTEHLDITRISLDWLRRIAPEAPSVQALLIDRQALDAWLYGRQLPDLLHEYPVQLDAVELLALLKPLLPRLYSISSSPRVDSRKVQLTVSTVRFACAGRERSGLCSGYLADRAEQGSVRVFVQKSAHFHVPADDAVPMIMVGPGTGVAPFRGFMHERLARQASGEHWLIFGEQRQDSDFYYREELQQWHRTGQLQRLDTAFSRDQAEKIYVQTRLREQGARLWQWLERGAYFYICGDAQRMAKDVDRALRDVVCEHGGLDEEQALAYVDKLRSDKRYLRDVY